MTEVLVAVPARDEVEEIVPCLEHVGHAARHALAAGACSRVRVAVAAHRCRDGTAAAAEAVLATLPCEHTVLRDDTSRSVGEVRGGLVSAALREGGGPIERTWLFNTDADSRVPVDWLSGTLAATQRRRAVAAAGMVALREWRARAEARVRYAAIIHAGLDGAGHSHVYGANLAVRLDAYLRVGGFRAVHAEDQDLVDRLRGAGEPVTSLLSPLVLTSARHDGRAENGLAALLERLSRTGTETPDVVA